MTKSCSKGVLVTEWWGERGCDCQGPAGIAVVDGDTLVQLELELEGWEEGGGISVSRQSNCNYSLTVVSACPYIVCLSIYV